MNHLRETACRGRMVACKAEPEAIDQIKDSILDYSIKIRLNDCQVKCCRRIIKVNGGGRHSLQPSEILAPPSPFEGRPGSKAKEE